MINLGFVGLGVMGSRMAKRLLDAGHSVTGYNRTRSKAQWLLDAGMSWADSPRAVAAATEITFSMIANTQALEAVTGGADGILAGLSAGKIYVDMSTVSPAAVRDLAKQVEAKGAQMLDSPVSGSVSTLEEGKLSFMVGGKRDTFEKVLPILHAIGPKATYVGANGLAVSMKVATNLSLAVQMLAFSEGVLLAGRKERHRARNRRRSSAQQRHGLAHGQVPGAVRFEHAGRSLVRCQYDAERPAASFRNGPPTRCAAANHGDRQSNAHCRSRDGFGKAGLCGFIRGSRQAGGRNDWSVEVMEHWSDGMLHYLYQRID